MCGTEPFWFSLARGGKDRSGMAVEKCRHALDQDFLRQALVRYSLRGMALLRDLEKKRGKKTQTSVIYEILVGFQAP